MPKNGELIDHTQPSRFLFADFGSDGTIESAVAQDATTGYRAQLFRVDGRNYIINLAGASAKWPSIPQMEQALIETAITMMPAASDPHLSLSESPSGPQYLIEMPPVTPTASAAVFDLYSARAVIDARDFRVLQFDASGALLRQPYSASFRLISRSVRPPQDVAATEFQLPVIATDVVLHGNAERDPMTDVMTTVLRELGRMSGN